MIFIYKCGLFPRTATLSEVKEVSEKFGSFLTRPIPSHLHSCAQMQKKSINFASKFRVIPLNLAACSTVQYAGEDILSFDIELDDWIKHHIC